MLINVKILVGHSDCSKSKDILYVYVESSKQLQSPLKEHNVGGVPNYLYDVGNIHFDKLECSFEQVTKHAGDDDRKSNIDNVDDIYSDIILSPKTQLNKGKALECDDDPIFINKYLLRLSLRFLNSNLGG